MPSCSPEFSQAQLLEAHPVLRRLSGQVIWCMFEEYEADPDDIQAFLDRFEQTKARTLPLIAAALDPAQTPLVRLRVENTPHACPQCRALDGCLLRLDTQETVRLLPPYGLGCPVWAEPVPTPTDTDAVLADPASIPRRSELLCGDWIFSHPWSRGL